MAFAQTWKREGNGGVLVEVPVGTQNQFAARDTVPEIRSILLAAGIPPQGVMVTPYQPASPDKLATIRIKYPKLVAEAGPCGLWPNDLGPSMDRAYNENKPYWNLGCASQRNLAAMVENPADLVQPRGEASSYTPRRTFVMDKYRRGEDTSTNYRNPDKAKISDVGK
jgi:pilus assembly protein CpaD